MKRLGYLYEKIYHIENLYQADATAMKGKLSQSGVQTHLANQDANIHAIHVMLRDKTYKTSPYTTFTIREPKEREIFRLPYYPDRIIHHAIMRILEPIFISHFTADTYSCIKGRGVHSASSKLSQALTDKASTTYCLKLDIRKFYPSVDHAILKKLLRRKFKDNNLLELLDGIIDSAPGLPIGNYLSQFFANYYLSFFDHWMKEEKRIKHYFRYADDLVILASTKEELHALLADIRAFLSNNLNLEVKGNYQIFPVAARGIDFLGYVHFPDYKLLRKSIKKRYARSIKIGRGPHTLSAYKGWAKHCHSRHLLKKLSLLKQCPPHHSKTSGSPPIRNRSRVRRSRWLKS